MSLVLGNNKSNLLILLNVYIFIYLMDICAYVCHFQIHDEIKTKL